MFHNFPPPSDYKLVSGYTIAKALEDLTTVVIVLSITRTFPLPLGASNVETSPSA